MQKTFNQENQTTPASPQKRISVSEEEVQSMMQQPLSREEALKRVKGIRGEKLERWEENERQEADVTKYAKNQ